MTQAAKRSRTPSARVLLLALLLALGSLLGLPVRAAADGPTTFSNTDSIAIPATGSANQIGPASPYPSNISVSGMTGAVTKVTVTFHGLTHGALGDVDAMVVAPNGENLVVLSDVGDPNQLVTATNINLTFDDSAPGPVPAQVVVPSGTYRPTNTNAGGATDSFPSPAPTPSNQTTLAGAFVGLTGSGLNGTWRLFVVDDATGDVGEMAGGWSLAITTEASAVSTTTTVSSSDATSTTGQSVTFTASVRAGGSAVTQGTVQFSVDGTNLGVPAPLNGAGNAELTTVGLTEGTHLIRATYSGATGFLTSNGTVSQRVDNTTVVTGTTFCNTGTITGPAAAAGTASPYPSNVFVSGLSGQVTKVTATLKGLSHSHPPDFDIMLSGPTPARNVVLLSDAGGQTAVSNADLIFDDAAAGAVPSPIVSGTYRPTDVEPTDRPVDSFPAPAPTPSDATQLSTFNNASGNGTWSLWVVDDATGDAGTINGGWCLTITSQAPTTTALTASPNPSTYGQSLTLSATVTSGGSPVTTGSVQFSDGGTALGAPVAVNGSGVATLTTSSLGVGSHPITATYGGTAELATSSGTVTQIVNRAATVTRLTSSLNPSRVGEGVTFTAAVTSGGDPLTTGSVQFTVDGTDMGAPLALNGSGQATYTTGALAAGTHTITATYVQNTNYATSDDDLDQVVAKITTTTDLTSSPNPSDFGQSVRFTATVTAGGSPASGGTIQFRDGTTDLGGVVSIAADGTATFDTSALTVGTHPITAIYSGTAALAGSTSDPLDQVVGQAPSTTVVSSSGTPSVFGDPVTFTATVASGGQPVRGGTVQFRDGSTDLGAPITVGPTGSVTYVAIELTAGTHPITAVYSGTTEIAGSSGSLDQVVTPATTSTALVSAPNPSTYGQQVTLTATVTSGGAALTVGSVDFTEGGTVLCEDVNVRPDGTATCAVSDLSVGTHALTASFSGTSNYLVSTGTVDQVVERASTSTTVASSGNPSAFGLPVTFTVSVAAGAAAVSEGAVTVFVDGTAVQVGTEVDSAGRATYTTSTLAAGSHVVRAEYAGSSSYLPSVSPDLQQRVEISADAGGPYAISEGDSVTLDASASSPTGDYQWDLNDDGVFGDATGIDPTLTWADLETFGIDDGGRTPTSYPVAVQISSGAERLTAASTITVTNTAPASVLTGDLSATVGKPFTIKVGADDPSSADMAAQFTYTVDWGDGSPVLRVNGPADPPVTHTYTSSGDYDASFTATDKDGGTGPGTRVVVVSQVADDDTDDDDSDNSSSDDDSSSSDSELASTGSSVGIGTILFGLALLGGGGAALWEARRRRR